MVLPDPLSQYSLKISQKVLVKTEKHILKIHCSYKIISTELKEKHILEQD